MHVIQLEKKQSVMILEEKQARVEKRPWFGCLPEQISDDFSFAVVGDRCGMAAEGVFEKALELLKDLKPEFVLAVGDLIEGYWSDAKDVHAEWDELDGKIQATGLPFFHAIGNHDYGNQLMADVWTERKGQEYYAFRAADVLFLTVNTEHTPDELSDEFIRIMKQATENVKREPERGNEHLKAFYGEMQKTMTPEQMVEFTKVKMSMGTDQLAFFQQVLADNKDVKWTFVNMHKPGWKSESEDYSQLLQMLGNRPSTIFAGHLHAMEYSKQGDREFIQLGRTGGLAHGEGRGDANLVLWVTMRGGVPAYRVVHLDGVEDIAAYSPLIHMHEEA